MDQIVALTQRVYRLEQEVARLKGAPLDTMDSVYAPDMPARTSPQAPMRPAAATAAVPAPTTLAAPRGADQAAFESEIAGTWFARIGAVALLLGAGFAFKYGIDRGLIGPGLRVGAGIVAGLALIAGSGWAKRRSWPVFAQAIAAAGAGLLFLSIWAGYHLYALYSAGPAFAALLAVTAGTAALGVWHDSEALAVLATIAGLLDPILVGGRARPAPLFGYLLVLDAGVLGVATARRWSSPPLVAFIGTWALFGLAAHQATLGVGFGYASALFALFAVPSFLRKHETVEHDTASAVLAVLNGVAYSLAGLALLNSHAHQWRGSFAAALAVLHLWAGGTTWMSGRNKVTATAVLTYGQVLLAAAAALQLHGNAIPVAWAVEAIAFVWIGTMTEIPLARSLGLALIAFSAAQTMLGRFELGRTYHPEQLLFSAEAGAIVVQIAALYAIAWLLHASREEIARQAALPVVVAANVITVAWISFEATAHYRLTPSTSSTALPFTLTAIWGLYAAALLAIGFAMRLRGARLMALALFGATIVKMGLVDLWLLETGFRVLAFLGLGVLLLTASLTYHRFRDVLFGDEERSEEDVKTG